MSAEPATDRSILPAVAAVLGLPGLVGVVGLIDGYPLPASPENAVGVIAGALLLFVLGAAVAWLWTVNLLAAPAVGVLGVVGGCGWALFAPGVTVVQAGSAVVLKGAPVLSRFVAVTPLLLVVVAGVAIIEASGRGPGGGSGTGANTTTVGHLAALAYGLLAGLPLVLLSLVPAALLGDFVTAAPLLLYAALGGLLGGMMIGYLRVRHRIVSPLVVLAVVTAVAAIAITAGGSPRGFPMAWPVWVAIGVILGAIEGVARGIQRRVVG